MELNYKTISIIMVICFFLSINCLNAWKNDVNSEYGVTDYANHDRYYNDRALAVAEGYPTIIYYLFPFYPTSYLFHVCILLPLCLFIYGHVLNRYGYEAMLGYFISFQWLFLTGLGVLKEIVTVELIILAMALIFHFLRKKNIAGLFLSGIVVFFMVLVQQTLQPGIRVLSTLGKGWNNLYLTALWGTLFFFTALQQALKIKNKGISSILAVTMSILFFIGLAFETRLLNLLFLIALPLLAELLFKKKI